MTEIEFITIRVRDGEPLHATCYMGPQPSKKEQALAILCHGFTGNREEWGRFPAMASALTKAGIDAIFFDFTGSGENRRMPVSLFRQVADLEDVSLWAGQQGYSRLATIGLSFGGLTSLLAEIPARRVAVFWAPAFYMDTILASNQWKFRRFISTITRRPFKIQAAQGAILIEGKFFADLNKAATMLNQKLCSFTIPSLIVQGLDDTAVTPAMSRSAFKLMPSDEYHAIMEIPGATHGFEGDSLNKVIQTSKDWIVKYIERASN